MNVRLPPVVIAALALAASDLGVAQNKAGRRQKYSRLRVSGMKRYKHSDVATTESPLADDFVSTFEDGSTFSKSGHIAHNADFATRTAAGKSSQPTTVFQPRQQEGLSFMVPTRWEPPSGNSSPFSPGRDLVD